MIESLIPKREELAPPPTTTPEPPKTEPPKTEPSETEQLKTQLQELKDLVAQLQKPPTKEPAATGAAVATPTPPTFPTAPTGGASSTMDHRAKFLEIYQRNPYQAAAYLEKHPTEIAKSTKELIS